MKKASWVQLNPQCGLWNLYCQQRKNTQGEPSLISKHKVEFILVGLLEPSGGCFIIKNKGRCVGRDGITYGFVGQEFTTAEKKGSNSLKSVFQEVHICFPLINGSLTATFMLHSENIMYISNYFGLSLTVRKV